MSDIDRKKMTFSQREGYEALPTLPKKEELPIKLKNNLWHLLDTNHFTKHGGYSGNWYEIQKQYEIFFVNFLLNHTNISHENVTADQIFNTTKNFVYNTRFDKTISFLELYLRDKNFSYFKPKVEAIFANNHPCWRILFEGHDIEFCYLTTDQETDTLKTTYEKLQAEGYKGAQRHLVNATQQFKDGQWADSIRESIHAVESVCKRIADNPKATLSDALNALKSKDIQIHSALKAGLDKIYAYTSDEKGIRHANIDFDTNCDQADAQFMLGACASFISYLCQKAEIA